MYPEVKVILKSRERVSHHLTGMRRWTSSTASSEMIQLRTTSVRGVLETKPYE